MFYATNIGAKKPFGIEGWRFAFHLVRHCFCVACATQKQAAWGTCRASSESGWDGCRSGPQATARIPFLSRSRPSAW